MAFSQRVQLIHSKANVCTFVSRPTTMERERERGNAPPNAKTKTTKKKTKKKNKRSQRACVCVRVCVYRRGERERDTYTLQSRRDTWEIKHERPKKGYYDAPKDILLLLLTRLIKKTSCCRNTNIECTWTRRDGVFGVPRAVSLPKEYLCISREDERIFKKTKPLLKP